MKIRYKKVEGDILCNIKNYGPYLDINYEELQNFNFVQSDQEEDKAEFSMINPKSTTCYFLMNCLMKYVLNWMKVNRICSILQCTKQWILN